MPDRPQPDRPTDDNPFAAPPEGRPDQLWEPRAGGDGGDPQKPGAGPGADPGSGPARWDPTDPIQRRARYALLAGMWGFFFGVFGIPSMGLLLGALALYWGISALRGVPAKPSGDGAQDAPRTTGATAADVGTGTGRGARTDADAAADAAPGAARGGLAALGAAARPQRTAAASGLVTASLAILLALSSYAVQLTYKDFYVCKQDALTKPAELQCNDLLPDNFIGKMLEVQR
ncbi:hypothetical protein ABT024_15275 [Streptomyces sp. NPDC002812]|uniref:hypothetical protein n=1 Tax=unclassified Streptomyces TaxID=2593676 RepID=UPI00202F46B2|nr:MULTISPECIES: hypothetical protein [unclassified Streptomyces]MCM1970402.1 hypothetical protein [Streptomyces sp. G1]MCX5123026.1 hypothetical protein [Streptomyces sp. NBC_00347]MCX5296368.1 hypothetical protein [Streptomyces sp. NBC_00193]